MSGAVSDYAFSDPVAIARRAVGMTFDADLFGHIFISVTRLVGGTLLGCVIGISLAFAVYLGRTARAVVAPTISFVANFPIVVWAPPIIAAFGVGEVSKIVFIAVTASLVMFAATFQGLQSIDGKLIEALSIYPKPVWTRIRYLYLPGSVPIMLEGLKTAVMFGWIALLFAEMMGSENGLGWLLWDARTFGRPADMMVALLVVGLIGKLSVDLIDLVAKRSSPWYGQHNGPPIHRGGDGASSRRGRDWIHTSWLIRPPAG